MPILKRSLGYTLLEILLTLSIVAIFMVMALPNLCLSSNHQKMRVLVQKIIQELYLARSEAIAHHQNIRYCSQTGTTNWDQGRFILDQQGRILHFFERLPEDYHLILRNSLNIIHELTFLPLGFTNAQRASFYLSSSEETFRIIISVSGKLRFEEINPNM